MATVAVTDASFQSDVLDASKPVLVDFWADWCGPCKMIAPLVDEVAKEFVGRLKVGKVDVDSNQTVANQFGIRSIPTLLVFKGGKVVEQLVGVIPKKALVDKLSKHLN